MKNIWLIVFTILFLSGCTLPTKYERNPSKPGYGRDAVKKSKCACLLIYENGIWVG